MNLEFWIELPTALLNLIENNQKENKSKEINSLDSGYQVFQS